jgi:hypothetical protein
MVEVVRVVRVGEGMGREEEVRAAWEAVSGRVR